MTLMIDLEPEVQWRLQSAATQRGLPVADYAREVLARQVLPLSLRVAALPPEEQDRLMTAAAEELQSLYNADLSLPPAQRELTAFTALDGEDFDDHPA